MTREEMALALDGEIAFQNTRMNAPYMEGMVAAAAELRKTCEYRETEDHEYWETSCGHQLVFEDEPPIESEHKFCSRCGGRLIEIPFVYPPDDDEDTA